MRTSDDGAPATAESPHIHNLAPRFILEQHERGVYSGELYAATMFVDISGFSAMTDTLMAHGQHGAEVAADIMRAALDPAIETVFRYGGFVANQAGDAITAVFPVDEAGSEADTARAALAAAVGIQALRQSRPRFGSPYGSFEIGVKVGLAGGGIQWGIVRSSDNQRAMYYFRGPAIDACAEAEHQAKSGDIILGSDAWPLLEDSVIVEPVGEMARLVEVTGNLPAPAAPTARPPDLALMRHYFPASVLTLEHSGEFRWVTNVFVALPTVRTDIQLHAFMQTVFELQKRYGGFINRLDFGDKGANLLIFWGAPIAHENDIQRALGFLLDLQALTSIPVSAGVTYRIAHAGTMGGALAEEYTCYGRGVNLAARLMTSSSPGDILVDEEIARRAENQFDLEYLGERSFKGFAEKQRVHQLFDRKEVHDELFRWPLVGRARELQQLEQFLLSLAQGHTAGAAMVLGESGMGKSHLVNAVRHSPAVEALGARWALCQADQTQRDSLHPFQYWLMDFFGQSRTQVEARNKLAFNRRMNALVADAADTDLGRELDRTRSFIGALIGLHWPDSLHEEMDAEGRFENTLEGLITLVMAESLRQPLILHIEDAQWLDADSLTLLERLWRRIEGRPIAMLLTARSEQLSADIHEHLLALIADLPWVQIDLARLTADDLAGLASDILDAPAANSLVTLLQARTEGNPLFAQQFVLHLKEQNLLAQDETGAMGVQPLASHMAPPDIQALIIARIDTLTQEIRSVVHTASVLGREFEIRLLSEMLRNRQAIQSQVALAEQAAIWQPLSELRYIFLHTLVRDTAYQMMTHQRRQVLHRLAAESIEQQFAADLTPHYGALGFHFEQASMAEPARRYLGLAGDQAARSYQNQAAIDLFSRALVLVEQPEQRLDLLLAREPVFDRIGQREAQHQDLNEARQIAAELANPQQQAEVALRQANLVRVQSRLTDALGYLDDAMEFVRQAGDGEAEARVWLLRGMITFQNGEYGAASQQLNTAHSLAAANDAQSILAQALYNLGNCALADEDYTSAQQHYADAMEIYQATHQHRGEVNCLLMSGVIDRRLGNLDEAMASYERALDVAREIGWQHGESYLLGHLGNHAFEMADYAEAGDLHRRALAISVNLGDKMLEAQSLDTLGLIDHFLGDPLAAVEKYRSALAIQQSIGGRRGAGFTLTHLGDSLAELGDMDAAGEAFQQALEIREALRANNPLSVDDLAGLARIALAGGRLDEARGHALAALDWLTRHGSGGVEFPAQAYLTAYETLSTTGNQEAAFDALRRGHAYLVERASRISNSQLRISFLESNPHHRALLAAWAEVSEQ
ncbi:MAG: tetratricopeptide repeat protein [Anaerolineae bacterium]|nr:tetratricopeptide repeat protein [Anaerolineae bacterium]